MKCKTVRDNKKREIIRCKRVYKINYDSEKHYSIHIQEAAAEYKTSAKKSPWNFGLQMRSNTTAEAPQRKKSSSLY